VLGDRTDPGPVDFDRDRALQETDGDYEPESIFDLDDDSFDAGQRPVADADGLSGGEEGVRLDAERRGDQRADPLDFFGRDGGRPGIEGNYIHHSGTGQHGNAPGRIEAAKHITGEQRDIDLFDAVGPLPTDAHQRKKLFDVAGAQGGRNDLLKLRADTHGEPGTRIDVGHNRGSRNTG